MIDSDERNVYEKPDISNLTVKRLIKLVNKLITEFTDERTTYYNWNLDYLTDSEDVIIEIDIQEDGELSYAYEYARDVFGTLAKDVKIRFDRVEKDGHQHWVEITLSGDIDLGEEG